MSEMRAFVDSNRGLDVDITDPEALRSWFAEKVDFAPPKPPAAGTMTLVGGRLCYFLDRRVIAYMYRVEGRYHSLYVMKEDGLETLEERRESLTRGVSASVFERDGYANVLWREGSHFYSLVAEVSPERLIPLAKEMVAGLVTRVEDLAARLART